MSFNRDGFVKIMGRASVSYSRLQTFTLFNVLPSTTESHLLFHGHRGNDSHTTAVVLLRDTNLVQYLATETLLAFLVQARIFDYPLPFLHKREDLVSQREPASDAHLRHLLNANRVE